MFTPMVCPPVYCTMAGLDLEHCINNNFKDLLGIFICSSNIPSNTRFSTTWWRKMLFVSWASQRLSSYKSVLHFVWGSDFHVNLNIENEQRQKRYQSKNNQIVPPWAKCNVVFLIVQFGRNINVFSRWVDNEFEFEKFRNVESDCKLEKDHIKDKVSHSWMCGDTNDFLKCAI